MKIEKKHHPLLKNVSQNKKAAVDIFPVFEKRKSWRRAVFKNRQLRKEDLK